MTDRRRILLALVWGALCHGAFAVGAGLMVCHLFFGLTRSWGAVPYPFAIAANLALLAQFPLLHSLLLTGKGRKILALIGPDARLATTNYALIASVQLALLFAFWSPSGVILWQATGAMFWVMCAAYAASWGYLMLAIWQGGPQLQSGMLGWFAMLRGRKPEFPDMPTGGLYRVTRQPIYLGFALTLWTMPTWTPDQLALATLWTAYCVLAPIHKERRFTAIYGDRFRAYRTRVPYWLPLPRKAPDDARPPAQ
ncbi:methyltransferase family protein [Jannaschia donghaensis]|nr:isoprenylcysteine carboxylmethyltransferase family protein [Jannaschia donghaensis]